MTDKEIIIDGINVSGCEFLNKTRHCKAHMSIMGTDANKCKCFPNCYFKQLKRKEQECEELNEQDTKDFANYKQALDEIEEFCTVYSANHDAYEMVYKDILAFINKVKEQK
jgi:hypothetical protein